MRLHHLLLACTLAAPGCNDTDPTPHPAGPPEPTLACMLPMLDPPQPVPLGYTLDAADLNQDGNLDLVTFVSGGPILLAAALGNGDGTFQPAIETASSLFHGIDDSAAVIADFNVDGVPDVAFLTEDSVNPFPPPYERPNATLSVFLGAGDGTFTAVPALQMGVTNTPLLLVSDLDGDAVPDLVMAGLGQDGGGPNVVAFGSYLGNGDGTFQPPVAVADVNVNAFGIADMNGDTRPDLVISMLGNFCPQPIGPGFLTCSGLQTYLGQGDGTFQPAGSIRTIELGTPSYGRYLNREAFADVDGDGHLDVIAVVEYYLSPTRLASDLIVVRGKPDGTFEPQPVRSPAEGGVTALRVIDIDRDGKLDVITTASSAGSGGHTAMVKIRRGAGDGTFLSPAVYPASPSGLVSGDFDNDGALDVVAGKLLRGRGDGTLSTWPGVEAGVLRRSTIADVNDDGLADLIGTNGGVVNVLINHGGTFQITQHLSMNAYGATISAAALSPLSADGAVALLALRNNDLVVYSNDGAGTFGEANIVYGQAGASGVDFGDVNGDGNVDAVLGSLRPATVSLLLGDGAGAFTRRADYPTSVLDATTPRAVVPALVDVNGDGEPDLLSTACYPPQCTLPTPDDCLQWTEVGCHTSVLLGDGTGGFTPAEGGEDRFGLAAAVGDINGDRLVDAVTIEAGSTVAYLGTGTGALGERSVVDTLAASKVALGDVDGDLQTDLVMMVEDGLRLYLGHGDGTFTFAYARAGLTGSPILADVDGDGGLDVLLTSTNGDTLDTLQLNQCTPLAP